MPNTWFESVAEAQRRAKRRLPSSVYGALLAGSEKGITYADNVQAFGEIGLAPHVVGHQSSRDLSTTVMGIPIALPVLISPDGRASRAPRWRGRRRSSVCEPWNHHGPELFRVEAR